MSTKTLKQKILEAMQKGDIASLYMLEQEAYDTLKEEELIGYYKNILDLALEKLTDTLEAKTQLDMTDVQNFATIRALYEYAMEHYHAGKINDAAALFEVLSGITTDKAFTKAMHYHTCIAQNNIDLDTFLEQYADMSLVEQNGNFYIADFTQKAHNLLESSQNKAEK
jgi:uncharacterized protein YfkK (UPF0435 family)